MRPSGRACFSSLVIRQATEQDLMEIANLEALLFPDNSLSPALIEREAKVSQVLVIGNPVYAYAIVADDGAMLDLLRLGVHPDRQGEGAGAQLLATVVARGRNTILTVRKDNTRALRLYLKFGFGIVAHFTSANAWVLSRAAGCTACPSTT